MALEMESVYSLEKVSTCSVKQVSVEVIHCEKLDEESYGGREAEILIYQYYGEKLCSHNG